MSARRFRWESSIERYLGAVDGRGTGFKDVVLASDYDTLAAERDQLAAENARLREAMLAVVARLDQPVFNGTESAGHRAANILRADIRSALAVARAALARATKEEQV